MSDVAVTHPSSSASEVDLQTVNVAAMTREEFISAHRNRLFRPKGKRNYYVLPVDREPLERNGIALPLMHNGYLKPGVTVELALATLYDETWRFGRDRKEEQKASDDESRIAAYKKTRDAALAFYRDIDIEKLACRFAEMLGHPRSKNQDVWVENLLVAAYTGNFGDHLRIANTRSKALFGEIFGVKLPSTDRGTREMLAARAPWPLPSS